MPVYEDEKKVFFRLARQEKAGAANMVHIRQSRPDYGRGSSHFQTKSLKREVFSSSLKMFPLGSAGESWRSKAEGHGGQVTKALFSFFITLEPIVESYTSL